MQHILIFMQPDAKLTQHQANAAQNHPPEFFEKSPENFFDFAGDQKFRPQFPQKSTAPCKQTKFQTPRSKFFSVSHPFTAHRATTFSAKKAWMPRM